MDADEPSAAAGSGDPYSILGVSRAASAQEVRTAYRRLLRQHRPEDDPAGFQRVRQAYEVLREGGFDYVPPVPAADPLPREPVRVVPTTEQPGEPWRDRKGLRKRLRALDARRAYGDFAPALNASFGEAVHSDPAEVSESVWTIVEGTHLSADGVAAVRAWIEGLDADADWILDAIDESQLRQQRRREARAALGQLTYPDALLELLERGPREFHRQLPARCAAVFDRADVIAIDVRRANRELRRRCPELWASWEAVRDALVDLTETDGRGRERRARAWDLAHRMDRPIERHGNRALAAGLGLGAAVIVVLFRLAGSALGIKALVAGLLILPWAAPWIARRSFRRRFVPELASELARSGVSMADLYWVLVERGADFQNWREFADDLRDHVPLWLNSATGGRP